MNDRRTKLEIIITWLAKDKKLLEQVQFLLSNKL